MRGKNKSPDYGDNQAIQTGEAIGIIGNSNIANPPKKHNRNILDDFGDYMDHIAHEFWLDFPIEERPPEHGGPCHG